MKTYENMILLKTYFYEIKFSETLVTVTLWIFSMWLLIIKFLNEQHNLPNMSLE